ncbi:autoinducer 2 ABC transporter substrate-binding protein [Peribacillus simplex]|uniref:Autoinducer 2 ABC transporter substrate-binding protein n=1 Tax=Peribacillus simplex NBRC 15720 = DSM 1321 TaxID=1349754 RepID=A0A223EC33_9BACI|nr:autoinducer 2 ABC transporter substrate-binding protein [Peribacillus simplex]ASS92802.1 autoinducer 2 ABC transporter substrate-binding protein [Peribacillus simplex NBRC 15720 = DSM 1321]MEC1398170.1 autoinducer 2 ABC transporter substrate-binding protein [Peribacillus simplex]MED3911846.1 autoinducer 2 ABC transporter substrate-binding protein [Peribacillus simplex]
MLWKPIFFILFLFILSGCNHSSEYEVIYNDEESIDVTTKPVENKKDPYTIAVIPKIDGIPYFNAVEEGALEAGKDLGVKVLYTGPPTPSSEKQEEIITKLIEKKVDVIAVSANDPYKLGRVLQKAKSKGIKVITWDSDTNASYRSFFVNMIDPEIIGRHVMDTLALEMEEKGEFAIMTGSPTAANLNTWIDWIQIQQKEYYPNMKLVEVEYTNEDIHKAYKVTQNLFKKYPGLKGIIGISTVNPPAAAQAVKDAGKIGQVAVVGTSTPNLMNEYLQEGAAQTITLWSPQKLGYLTVSLAKNLLNDEFPYEGQNIKNIGTIKFNGEMVIMGEPIDFTKGNVNQYDF